MMISVVTFFVAARSPLCCPSCLIGSSSTILRRSMVKFCFSSASAVFRRDRAKELIVLPAFCAIVTLIRPLS